MKNKKLMKGVAIATIAAMSMGMLAGCGGGKADKQEEKQYKVGVVQLVQHGALDQANQGMIAGLADNGFVEGENLIVTQEMHRMTSPTYRVSHRALSLMK